MIIMEIVAKVVIRGGGIAATTAAHLLRRAGCSVAWRNTDRPRLPAILLSEAAQALLSDIFEKQNLFRDCHPIRKRVVAWGREDAVTVEHSAVVVSEDWLLDHLRLETDDQISSPAWTIFSSRPPHTAEHRFGSRIASATRVELSDSSACAIEALDAGWLFLVPDAPGSGWLLAVGEAPLDRSRVIAKMISRAGAAAGEFPAYPQIVSPLAGEGWLACGSAAMSFDPICGDGTGNAVREAILASAVIGAALKGHAAGSLIEHYQARLKLGFKRHLMLCRDFYRTGGPGIWWRREAEAIEEGIVWCGAEPRFRYQLAGFELAEIPRAAVHPGSPE